MSIVTVIPVYNGERFLRATLESVAAQSRRPDRLIVVDDCSTDGTRELVRSFRSMPCELVLNEKNLGLFGNLNRCLDYARESEFFHLLLADDLVSPTFIAKLVVSLESTGGFALGYSQVSKIDEHGKLVGGETVDGIGGFRNVSPNELIARQSELQSLPVGSVLLKTNRSETPVRFRMDMPHVADCVFYGEWAAHCPTIIEVREKLCQIRHHPYSATSKNVQSLQAWALDEWRAMEMISPLIKESASAKALRQQKLRSLFAARSYVKVQMMRKEFPDYARQIEKASKEIVGPLHWQLGRLAVLSRDLCKPKANPARR